MTTPPGLPYPSGWFALAASADLASGTVLARRIAGEERVLFRTEAGEVACVEAYCPHLGAHLAEGGTVRGDTIVCPFHGFRFDRNGECVATGYGTRPPKAARMASFPVTETGGWIFTWYDAGSRPPSWTPPVLDTVGLTTLRTRTLPLRSHPQETTENSVDLGHFLHVHGYADVTLEAVRADGPHLHTRYSFTRPGGVPGFGRNLRVEISVHVWGLGFSYVDGAVPAMGMTTRHFVLPTSVDPENIELRLGTTLRHGDGGGAITRRLRALALERVVSAVAHQTYLHDVKQDRPIWERKIHLRRPSLAEGDGPIGTYRAWCRQFYAGVEEKA